GETIGGMEKFADWKVSSRSAQTEYPIFCTFNFRRIEVGEYKLKITVYDEFSKKTATTIQTFVRE
ncbi:MAG: hypothetical protein JRD68_14320, partial [Deltaproteobacteria bacterium]|nr:hypothetical protein [Deltaproteobacteria bacterium]